MAGAIQEKQKLENIENTNNNTSMLVPLPLEGELEGVNSSGSYGERLKKTK